MSEMEQRDQHLCVRVIGRRDRSLPLDLLTPDRGSYDYFIIGTRYVIIKNNFQIYD